MAVNLIRISQPQKLLLLCTWPQSNYAFFLFIIFRLLVYLFRIQRMVATTRDLLLFLRVPKFSPFNSRWFSHWRFITIYRQPLVAHRPLYQPCVVVALRFSHKVYENVANAAPENTIKFVYQEWFVHFPFFSSLLKILRCGCVFRLFSFCLRFSCSIYRQCYQSTNWFIM